MCHLPWSGLYNMAIVATSADTDFDPTLTCEQHHLTLNAKQRKPLEQTWVANGRHLSGRYKKHKLLKIFLETLWRKTSYTLLCLLVG